MTPAFKISSEKIYIERRRVVRKKVGQKESKIYFFRLLGSENILTLTGIIGGGKLPCGC